MTTRHLSRRATVAAATTALACTACSEGGPSAPLGGDNPPLCELPQELFTTGAFPEAIPALTEPQLIPAARAGYLADSDRVLGVVSQGEARAYPHRLLWHHEIVNDRFGERWITVSFCPLTGSGLAMDATLSGSRVEFAVSGLLFANNLVMFDRLTEDLYGPQLGGSGRCERFAGLTPEMVPVQEMSWARWKQLHPETLVLSENTGHARDYRRYPYGAYDELGNDELLFPMTVDRSRPLKERVLSVRAATGTIRAYPFGELAQLGSRGVVNDMLGGEPVTVLFDGGSGGSAVAYRAQVDGQRLTFEAAEEGWRDTQTGTTWNLAGRAVSGALVPRQLGAIPDAYVAFWFAWRHFEPDGEIWRVAATR